MAVVVLLDVLGIGLKVPESFQASHFFVESISVVINREIGSQRAFFRLVHDRLLRGSHCVICSRTFHVFPSQGGFRTPSANGELPAAANSATGAASIATVSCNSFNVTQARAKAPCPPEHSVDSVDGMFVGAT